MEKKQKSLSPFKKIALVVAAALPIGVFIYMLQTAEEIGPTDDI